MGRPVEDQTGQKSVSAYECIPFILLYNAQPIILEVTGAQGRNADYTTIYNNVGCVNCNLGTPLPCTSESAPFRSQ